MIKIRNAESAEDIASAKEMFEEYARSLGFSLCFQGFDQELATLPGEYAPPSGRLLIGNVEGRAGGCVALHRFGKQNENTCEIKRLYVRPEFRGQKIGKRLMDAALEAAKEIGYRRVLLDTITGKMDTAIAMYRAYGFREIESYRQNPVAGVLYMELDLTSGSRS